MPRLAVGRGGPYHSGTMLILAHAGITLGMAVVLKGVCGRRSVNDAAEKTDSPAERADGFHPSDSWFTSAVRSIDLRVLLVGSLLPDIIDKPVGRLVYGTFGCRLFCHTLVFLLLIALAGLYLYFSRHRKWLLVLGFGVFMHLVLDGMWLDTETLLWPVQGLSFPAVDRNDWEQGILHELFHSPGTYIPELVGLLVLGWIAWLLVRRGKLRAFIKDGLV